MSDILTTMHIEHGKALAAKDKRIAKLEAECRTMRNLNVTLTEDNERLRAALNGLIDGLWDKHSLFIAKTLEQNNIDEAALRGQNDE